MGCAAHATVTGDDGATYEVDAEDATATVPRAGTAVWSASIVTPTHDHRGRLVIELGPVDVTIGSWGVSRNEDRRNADSGTKRLPSAFGQVPGGKFRISGFHRGDEGACVGHVTVEVAGGSPFATPAGMATFGLVLAAGAGVVASLFGRPRARGGALLGAVSGLLFGLAVAAELVFFGAVRSDSTVLVALPVALLALGVLGGATSPLGHGGHGTIRVPVTPPQ